MWAVRVFVLPVARDVGEPGGADSVWRGLVHFMGRFWCVFSLRWWRALTREVGEGRVERKMWGEVFSRVRVADPEA